MQDPHPFAPRAWLGHLAAILPSPRATRPLAFLAAASIAAVASAQVVPGSIDEGTAIDPFRARFLDSNPGSGLLDEDGRLARVYGAAFSNGSNAVESAERFLRQHAPMLGSNFAQLMAVGPNADGTHVLPVSYDPATDSYRFSLVGYTQHVNGVPVFRGDVRCLVRNEPGYPLVLVSNGLRDLGDFGTTFTGGPVSPSKIDLRRATRRALNQFGPGAEISAQEQVIWAGYEGAPVDAPRIAVKFIVTGTGVFDRELRQRILYLVDPANGEILFQEDQIVNADMTVAAKGNATADNRADACSAEIPKPLPYARFTFGTTTSYADAFGVAVLPNVNTALTVTGYTDGRYFKMNDVPATESAVAMPMAEGAFEFLHNAPNTDEGDRAEVNAYIEANRVRDFLMATNPSFPTIPGQQGATAFQINVRVSGTCNAFYDGVSINFYPAGGGCNNTAFSTVVHHEYGHHVVNVAGSGQGAYGEGFGDVMGVLVTDESLLAIGFQTCGTGIRNASNTCQYSASGCSSCGSEIHACGMLLSGCVWSLRQNLVTTYPTTYRAMLADLCLSSVLLHTGTTIGPSITVDFLTLDDDDGNIGNGTPNYAAINGAFSAHGLPGPALELISFNFPAGRPTLALPSGGTPVEFTVAPVSGTPAPGTGKLGYRFGSTGGFTLIDAVETSPNAYRALLPGGDCGARLEYYVAAEASTGVVVTSPSSAPFSNYAAISAIGIVNAFADTVETNLGWSLSTTGDTATSGIWTRVDPIGTQAQPEDDVTPAPGTICFVTGQGTVGGAAGQADVDGGKTTLTSPTMNATGGIPYISYSRWYSNSLGQNPNADVFRVEVSSNNGATWVPLETVGPTGAEVVGGWFQKEFNVLNYVAATNQFKIRFIADDAGGGSLIEAAVDEIRLRVFRCDANADVNGDGIVDASDLALVLGSWGLAGAGDLNGDGTTDATDLAILLANWG